MTYVYSNEEIESIAEKVGEELFTSLTNDISYNSESLLGSYARGLPSTLRTISWWNKEKNFWNYFCRAASRISKEIDSKGISRNILSRDQQEIVQCIVGNYLLKTKKIVENTSQYKRYKSSRQ